MRVLSLAFATTTSLLGASAQSAAQSSSLSAVQQVEFGGPQITTEWGQDVFLEGTTALVFNNLPGSYHSLQVYYKAPTGWWASTDLIGAYFSSASFEGALALCGSPVYGGGHVTAHRTNALGQWTYSIVFSPDPISGSEDFGIATAIDGTTVVIANPLHTQNFAQEGALYVYEDDGTNLVLRQSIYGGAPSAKLGEGIGLHGDDMLARFFGPSGTDLRAFRRVAGQWSVAQAALGLGVVLCQVPIAMDDGLAAARVFGGSVIVLARASGPWFVEATIPGASPYSSWCASDAALEDGVLAYADPYGNAVHLYARNDGWKLQTLVVGSDTQGGDYFGYGFGLQGERLVVGGPRHDHYGNNFGSLYEFKLTHSPARVHCVPELTSLGCIAHMGFQGTPSASSASPFTLTASNVLSHRAGALVYGTSGALFLPYPGGVRCVAPPRRTVARQSSGGSSSAYDCSGSLAIDFNALAQTGVDPLLFAGVQVNAQWIFRDPSGASALASSEAIEFTIGL